MKLATALLAAPLLLGLQAQAQSRDEVRIYRCTDATGRDTLRDTPCPKGQRQQARDMLRPKDAPRAARRASPAVASTARTTTVPVVYLAPPRPIYDCTTPDGVHYTSENGDGNPRWVPLWTLGDPFFGRPTRIDAGRGSFRPAPSGNASIGRAQNAGPGVSSAASRHSGYPHWHTASGAGTWIRDDCAMLPPAEACARLRDRRAELRTRFFNAMPSERDVLRVEERSLNARLDNDCGGH